MTKYEELKQALITAREEAQVFINTEDGGTCNFDAPALNYNGMQKKKVIEMLKSLGLSCYDWKLSKGFNRLVICGFESGMGNRRTRMAEKFAETMTNYGYDCGMYYQMD